LAKPQVRLNAVFTISIIGLLVLILRAAQIQLVDGAEYAAEAAASRTEQRVLTAPRGAILDRWGTPLAANQEVFHISITPAEFVDASETVRQLREALGVSSRLLNRELGKQYGYLRGPFTSADVQPIRNLRGVYFQPEPVRFYPNAGLAASLLGRPASDGTEASGLERFLDTLLTGIPGFSVVLQDQFERTYESPARLDAFPVPGHDVRLTIDVDLQDLVERSLTDAMEKLQATSGDVAIVDPRTGEILALTSRSRRGGATVDAFTSPFEPGSTAKLFTAAALISGDLVTPDDSVWGENGKYVTPHRTIEDEHDEGWMTLRDVIRRSSNIGIAKLSSRLEAEQQFHMLRAFGMGTPTGVEFPSESPGRLPRPESWSVTSSASLAIGYEVAVTTLQLAQAFSVLANDGVMMQPTLVAQVLDPYGRVVYQHRPRPVRRVLPADHATTLRSMLRDVVYDGGTGEAAALTTYEVAGKTGTARRFQDGEYVRGSHVATFVSLFPANDPQLVMVVKLDNPVGSYAAASAVPMTKSMLEQILAGRSPALDRLSLGNASRTPSLEPDFQAGTVPFVVFLPRTSQSDSTTWETVPDLQGHTARAAARELHARGLRVHLEGWGTVRRTIPEQGAVLTSGSTVTVVLNAESRGGV
jgi:cell division protein FtsI (penicillin-binding protein 3)